MSVKTVLILGANSDIGFALATEYKQAGYTVLLAARTPAALEERLKAFTDRSEWKVIRFDALKYKEHKSWFASLPGVPDITCCVFGYLGDQIRAEGDWEEAQSIIESNYTGAVSVLNAAAEVYKKRSAGVIVGISSVAGDRGRQSNYMYGSAKAGFTTYLAGLRNALYKHNVHVLTVKPGYVATKMTAGLKLPPLLVAKPERVAKAIRRAVARKKNSIYVLPVWFWIMLVIKCIPEFIFKRLKM